MPNASFSMLLYLHLCTGEAFAGKCSWSESCVVRCSISLICHPISHLICSSMASRPISRHICLKINRFIIIIKFHADTQPIMSKLALSINCLVMMHSMSILLCLMSACKGVYILPLCLERIYLSS